MEIEESEILSLKNLAQTFLSKIEALEKKMVKKPSRRAQNKQAGIDRQYTRLRANILKRQQS